MLGGCPVGIDEQTFIEAVAKELNRSPWMLSLVGLWRFDQVRDAVLEQFEATADEGGHLGVAVASFNRGDEEQSNVWAACCVPTLGLPWRAAEGAVSSPAARC